MTAFGMTLPNSFEHGYVLHQPKDIAALAADLKTTQEELLAKLGKLRATVLKLRDQREAPLKDDKVVTSWNGLMIKAYANAGATFERKDYTDAAVKAADFLLTQLRDKNGRLLRTWRGGSAKLNAYLDDYAFVIAGLLELHRHTNNQKWLDAAVELSELQHKHYWSVDGKGYFFTADDHEDLIARTRNGYDNVMPSGNGYAARNLLQLASITGEQKYRQRANETLQAFAPVIKRIPGSMTTMAIALAESFEPPTAVEPPLTEPAAPATPRPAQEKKTAEDNRDEAMLLQPLNPVEQKLTFVSFQSGSKSGSTQPATPPQQPAKKKKPKYVNAKAYLSVDKLPAGKSCRIVMVVDVSKGWHINSNPASPDFLEPTRLVIKSKYGTKLTRIRYPKAKKLNQHGDEIHVYEGKVEIHGLIEIPLSAAGKTEQMEIVLEYQACDSKRCLRPMKVTLGGKVPVAQSLDQVKMINLALFPDLKKQAKKPTPRQ